MGFGLQNDIIKVFAGAALLAASCFGLATAAQAGTVYKWVDSKGVVHYSQTMPKDKNVKPIDVRSGAPARSTVAAPESDKEKPNPEQEKIKNLEGDLKAEKEARLKQQCQAMKTSLDNFAMGGRIYEMQDGERKFLNGKEIDERRIKVRDSYMKKCAGIM